VNRALAGAGLLVVAITGAGCGDDDGGEDAIPALAVTVGGESEYRFNMPDTIEAGAVRIDVTNTGDEPHHAQVFRLDDDATVDDLRAELATGEPPAALEVGTFLGGTALVGPGDGASQADAIVDLDAGQHVLLCFVPDPTGTPHVAHGMMRPFEVTDSSDPAPPPVADSQVALDDFRFDVPLNLDGDDVLEIANAAPTEAHEMVVARLDDDADIDDVVAALDARRPIPATGVGGMQALLPGDTQHLALDLTPGRYALFCAVTSRDGTPHYRAGMASEVTVT
jgi:hypothetical protein